MRVIWLKKDLRLTDNASLNAALSSLENNEELIPLYIFEPEMWDGKDYSLRHFKFLRQSLEDINEELEKKGSNLLFKIEKSPCLL